MIDNQQWPTVPARCWKDLLEATVVETDCSDLPQRIKEAQDAVMDEIEVCYPTASDSERQSLVNSLNALREFRRLCETPRPGKKFKTISLPSDAQA